MMRVNSDGNGAPPARDGPHCTAEPARPRGVTAVTRAEPRSGDVSCRGSPEAVAAMQPGHDRGGLLLSEILVFIEEAEILVADLTNERRVRRRSELLA
jgi:hypothetical protein